MLAPFVLRHPFLCAAFAERITNGAELPVSNIYDHNRIANVTATLAGDNQKSARVHEAKLFLEMLKDEVRRGWQLPLPKEAANIFASLQGGPAAWDGVADDHRSRRHERVEA